MTSMLTCKAYISSTELMKLVKLQTYILGRLGESTTCMFTHSHRSKQGGVQHGISSAYSDTFTGKECCLVLYHLVLI